MRRPRVPGVPAAVFAVGLLVLTGASSRPLRAQSGTRLSSTDSWTATSTAGAPTGRINHSAVWTGSRMIVWGGSDAGGELSTGGRYDPATDTWASVQLAGAPAGRAGHATIWTGEKMIVWGGYSQAGPTVFGDGAAYDPAANTWTAISGVNAPSARYLAAAVWTGEKLIIWGGYTSYQSLAGVGYAAVNTGGVYDPATDTWTAMSTVDAPSPRALASLVWTGSRMIVWGGDTGTYHSLGEGGVYDPAEDKWTAISTAGEPGARLFHTAVWTGSSMIVWGGFTGSDQTDTGGAFDPSSNAWSSTAEAGAPEARELHVAAWTGSRMIVWAGDHGEPVLNSGGLYDPATKTWAATAISGAPAARAGATAVWTGEKLIAWGGGIGDNVTFLATGGVYTPPAVPCPPGGSRGCFAPFPGGAPAPVSGRP
jgi:hypothetical protein